MKANLLKPGINTIRVRVTERGPFKPVHQIIQIEKVELHLR